MSIMLEKITVGVVPSSLVRKARMTERILGDVVTGLQDAIGRVYGNRAGFISDSTPNGDRSYLFGLSMVRVSYEVHGITRGDVQAKVTVEGSQGLDPQPTGTFLRAMLESHELLEKDGDVQADFISKDATETGQRALGRFNVRATAAVRYEDGKYKMVELSGSAAGR